MRRTTILTSGCVPGLFILLSQLLARPTSGHAPATSSQAPGRFQMATFAGGICVLDTGSRQCWIKTDSDVKKWTDLESPAEQKKE
jgi:hypothetical protein